MSPTRYIPYYRISTVRQGQSSLGLEAQRAAVHAFAPQPGQLLTEFVEVESGRKNQRPQLLAAIGAARQHHATLLIAKLDRLSRNASFILALRDSGVDFVCCDMPDANTLTVGIFALIAQHEREMISQRTKDALAAKKARGEVMGAHAKLTPEIIAKSLPVRQANAAAHPQNRQASRLALSLHKQGLSLQQIATELTAAGFRTRRPRNPEKIRSSGKKVITVAKEIPFPKRGGFVIPILLNPIPLKRWKEVIKSVTIATQMHITSLHTVAFNDLEDEFFGAPGTADWEEYDAALELAMIPSTIKAYRLQHNLTQAELGERVGVQKAQISKLERNASNVTLDTLRKVFAAMQTVVKIQLVPQA